MMYRNVSAFHNLETAFSNDDGRQDHFFHKMIVVKKALQLAIIA